MYFIVVGCGKVGAHLARILSEEHNVAIIDRNSQSFESLKPVFNGLTITGSGMDLDVLREAGIERCDALAAVSSDDNVNLVIGQVARRIFHVPKVVVRVTDPVKAEVYRGLGYEIINGSYLVAEVIRDKLIEGHFSTYILESSQVSMLEVIVSKEKAGRPVSTFNLPDQFYVALVVRHGEPLLPEANLVVHDGDRLIGVVKIAQLKHVRKILGIT
ncbi:MAG TPA: TrkA family potassium uptake protein [bacterium]|nr:TrkA family potassium uptake protein [bacterium]HOL67908.1 TrkA family potassium uptake protein [bacterium]HPP13340.1 TrkA family potassium uptake protein [bacterium]